jgi:two-component system, OmpR family, sensor kinase
MVKDIDLNSLEKRSFYSFLTLYIISSMLFIFFSAYWYYTAQKNALENNQYYKLQHIADTLSQKVIAAHMRGLELNLPEFDEGVIVALIDINLNIIFGSLAEGFFPKEATYVEHGKYSVLTSDAPQEHLNIKFVVVQSKALFEKTVELKKLVSTVVISSIFMMITLAWLLARLFMKPLHQKIKQIEDFVHDTAHELYTPITALSMSVSRALKKEAYDKRTLKNISISTKQLFDMYTALSYLSFEQERHQESLLDVSAVLRKSIEYYRELSESKRIKINISSEPFEFEIEETKLAMLFGNLINNAIKYSNPDSNIEVIFKQGVFSIQDFGIGIEEDKVSKIYERYNRETEYAGGFGIGLSIVQKISNEYGLILEVESEPGKGTCFRIKF